MSATKFLVIFVLASTEALFLDKKIYLINKLKNKLGEQQDLQSG